MATEGNELTMFTSIRLWYVLVLVTVLGFTSSLVAYNYGYSKGETAGFTSADTACKLAREQATTLLLTTERNELVEASRAIAESLLASASKAKQLDKKIGALREQAKFTSTAECKLSDDELRNLQRAYRVQEDAGPVPNG